mmetsp:Transcript_23702/g.59323  ORF Transcript_23702/g.59323 Transcript_23702/m.59323 type:complete len:200 (-) Transcript_23702:782-1381(-)
MQKSAYRPQAVHCGSLPQGVARGGALAESGIGAVQPVQPAKQAEALVELFMVPVVEVGLNVGVWGHLVPAVVQLRAHHAHAHTQQPHQEVCAEEEGRRHEGECVSQEHLQGVGVQCCQRDRRTPPVVLLVHARIQRRRVEQAVGVVEQNFSGGCCQENVQRAVCKGGKLGRDFQSGPKGSRNEADELEARQHNEALAQH